MNESLREREREREREGGRDAEHDSTIGQFMSTSPSRFQFYSDVIVLQT